MPRKTLTPLSSDNAERFREVCRSADYTDTHLEETLGTEIPPPQHHEQWEQIASLAAGDAAFHALARLFFLGTSIRDEEANAVLPSSFLRSCVDCGLLATDGNVFRSAALVVPVGDMLLAADLHLAVSQDDGSYVPTISQPALHLRSLAIRKPTGRMLDLCGGFALHGIMASHFSSEVVTTDLNPRAKEYAVFNAALNGCDNIKAVTGNLFGPVQGERYDLILSNPPFVVSFEGSATFRDSPIELDGFVHQMLTQASDYLEDGGVFQAICEWVEFEGQDWQERLAGWFQGSGCDVWVLTANRQSPSSYAQGRLRETTSDETELASNLESWEQNFRDRRVASIHGGFIFLRRRQGANWFDVTQITRGIGAPIGDAIAQGFEGRDLVFCDDGDQALLASRLGIANGMRQVAKSHWERQSWRTDSISLQPDDGLPVSIGVDDQVLCLVEMFDGDRSVDEALEAFANRVGIPVESARKQGLQLVRSMIQNGVLVILSQ